jgi:acyl-coenzyme A thioesterase 13
MGDPEADREKAMAAVKAMFERYKLIAAQRPKDHIVSMGITSANRQYLRDQDFDREVMESMKVVDAGLDGSVAFEMTIGPNFSNLNSA